MNLVLSIVFNLYVQKWDNNKFLFSGSVHYLKRIKRLIRWQVDYAANTGNNLQPHFFSYLNAKYECVANYAETKFGTVNITNLEFLEKALDCFRKSLFFIENFKRQIWYNTFKLIFRYRLGSKLGSFTAYSARGKKIWKETRLFRRQ